MTTTVNYRGRDLPVTEFDTWTECEETLDQAWPPSGDTAEVFLTLTSACAPELEGQADAIVFTRMPACPDHAEVAFKVHEEFNRECGGEDD